MALTATLEFGDNNIKRYTKRYLISDYQLVFNRSYNAFAPQEMARCERLDVTVIAPGKNDLGLIEWFSSQSAQDGRILISSSYDANPNEEDSQVICFEEGKCFSLSENYDIDSQRRRLIRIAIIAEELNVDGVNYNCK